ncbi:MAG: OB-fold putative lipoprotein [Cytophagaceae bacterium]|nr:OB-fold putative lipoprotein [Cytophagaceae bacterium]MDW8456882.1 hypothetical protein [Cytophagaceae bacterium]
MIKKISIGLSVFVVFTACIIYFLKCSSDTDVLSQSPVIIISADSLFMQYQTNEVEANQNYLNKVLQVNGVVSDITRSENGEHILVLKANREEMFGILCSIDTSVSNADGIKPGDRVAIKGICKGGGEMSDVILYNCITSK